MIQTEYNKCQSIIDAMEKQIVTCINQQKNSLYIGSLSS